MDSNFFSHHNFGSWNWFLETNKMEGDSKNYKLLGLNSVAVGSDIASFFTLIHPEDKDRILEDLAKAIATKTTFTSFFRLKTPGGYKFIKTMGSIFYKDQEAIRISGINWPAEEGEDLLSSVTPSGDHQSRMSSLGQVAATIAHEINTPLTSILCRVEFALSQKLPPEVRTQLTQVVKTVNNIAKLTDGVKSLARNGEQDPFENIKISDLREEINLLCEGKLKRHNVQLSWENIYPGSVPGRKVQLVQVLVNLINNSIDAVKNLPNPWIRISSKVINDKFLELRVMDSGAGIPQELQDKIFQLFFTTKPAGQGTGMGLGLCSKILSQHKGSLILDNNQANTCFVVKLPLNN